MTMQPDINQIIHADCFDVLPTLQDDAFDAVITDPPYGMGLDTWDKPVDIPAFIEQVKRVGREFFAVFGQMPYIAAWHQEAVNQGLHFMEHISWVKRNCTPTRRLTRGHESIYIYAINGRREFYTKKGRYEDVKVPGLAFDVVSLEGIKRTFSEIFRLLDNRDDGERKSIPGGKHEIYHRFRGIEQTIRDKRCSRMVNFSNIWSFLPQSKRFRAELHNIHPNIKPLLLMERLIELLTPDGASVLDPFSGSGTTAIAAQRLNRQFLCIEKEHEYWSKSCERLESDAHQPQLAI
jgi:DNA modification methylase